MFGASADVIAYGFMKVRKTMWLQKDLMACPRLNSWSYVKINVKSRLYSLFIFISVLFFFFPCLCSKDQEAKKGERESEKE